MFIIVKEKLRVQDCKNLNSLKGLRGHKRRMEISKIKYGVP